MDKCTKWINTSSIRTLFSNIDIDTIAMNMGVLKYDFKVRLVKEITMLQQRVDRLWGRTIRSENDNLY